MTVIRPPFRRSGHRALLLEPESTEEVHRVWRALRADPAPGVEDVVAGSRTVLLVLRSEEDRCAAELRLLAGVSPLAESGPARVVAVPVAYDGPDLEEVAELAGMHTDEVVRVHAGAVYTVSFLGFSPGFAYLAGVDPALHLPRLATPRRSVPSGAVALAAGMTAVYPQATPGGWRIIGRSSTRMFDPSKPYAPSLLLPGDRVRFVAVDRLGPPVGSVGEPAVAPPDGAPYLEVVAAGMSSTVQDRGRSGWAHLGGPAAGAADRFAAERANRLVGNPPDAAVLETVMAGLRIRMGADRRVALTGALVELTVDGLPARPETALPLRAGSELAVGRCLYGLRSYLAVEGGITVRPVLGSRSTDTLSGIGPPPLRSGDRLPVGPRLPARPRSPTGPPSPVGHRERRAGDAGISSSEDSSSTGSPVLPFDGGAVVLRARRGPRDDWVGPGGVEVLGSAEYRVTSASDRVGVRLSGPPVAVGTPGQLSSEGLVPGAVEIPPDGHPIVMLRNHPSTGGYPVVAVVDDAGVDLLAQCRPGVRVRFEIV